MKHLNFSYSAGKVGGVGGFVEDVNLAGGPGSAYVPPGMAVQYNANGTVDVSYTALGFVETFNWYTGGTPSGPTTFSFQVTNTTQTPPFRGVTFSHAVGTHSGTYFAVFMPDSESTGVGVMDVVMSITRNGTTVQHSWTLSVRLDM